MTREDAATAPGQPTKPPARPRRLPAVISVAGLVAHAYVLGGAAMVCFFDCRPYPNGDLLVVFHGLEKMTHGYGLAKLDKDSNVLWKYAANAHHDVDVGEDGTVYALRQDMVYRMPKCLEYVHTP